MKRFVGTISILMLFCLVTVAVSAEKAKSKIATKPSKASYVDPTTGMEFVKIPGGCYMMGDVFNAKSAGKSEKPVHEVCLDSFYLGKYEVTQAQWTEIMGSNPSHSFGEKLPVEQVSWNDVQNFIVKLNQKSGKQYRLPTEAEWEYAARSGGKKELWPGTNDGNDLDRYAWYSECESCSTHPVGQKRPNGLGLYDMTGNVVEWCNDYYNDTSYDDDFILEKPRNPQGASKNSGYWGGDVHVIRGGYGQRTTGRDAKSPEYSHKYIGFRLARFI